MCSFISSFMLLLRGILRSPPSFEYGGSEALDVPCRKICRAEGELPAVSACKRRPYGRVCSKEAVTSCRRRLHSLQPFCASGAYDVIVTSCRSAASAPAVYRVGGTGSSRLSPCVCTAVLFHGESRPRESLFLPSLKC